MERNKMYKIAFFIVLFSTIACHAGTTPPRPQCLTDLGKDSDFTNAVATKIGTNDVQQWITNHKPDFYTLVADGIKKHCLENVSNISEFNKFLDNAPTLPVKFAINDQWYDFNITKENVFDYIDFPTAVLVVNIRNLTPGQTLSKKSITKSYFFNDMCSDHYVRLGSDADTDINTAGQASYPVTENKGEFFLDFPIGKSNRIFPGLLLINAKGWGGAENITMIPDYLDARKRIRNFTEKLQNSSCSSDGLAAYVIKLPIEVSRKSGRGWWNYLICIWCYTIPKNLGNIKDDITIMDGPYTIK